MIQCCGDMVASPTNGPIGQCRWHSLGVTAQRSEGPLTWAERLWWVNLVASAAFFARFVYLAWKRTSRVGGGSVCAGQSSPFSSCTTGSRCADAGPGGVFLLGAGHDEPDEPDDGPYPHSRVDQRHRPNRTVLLGQYLQRHGSTERSAENADRLVVDRQLIAQRGERRGELLGA